MNRKVSVAIAPTLLVAAAPLLSVCYTTAGAGQDLQAAGKGIEHSADKNTSYHP